MRPIEFQDSFSRAQNIDKIQSRDLHKPLDDAFLAAQKQAAIDEQKRSSVQTSEEARDKLVNKDKEKENSRQKQNHEDSDNKEGDSKEKRRPSADGFHIIDIDA